MKTIIRFSPKFVPGKAWKVVMIIGSRKTGRTEVDIGFEPVYTLAQAQVAADNAARDERRHGSYSTARVKS